MKRKHEAYATNSREYHSQIAPYKLRILVFLSNHIDEVEASYDCTGVFPSVGSLTHPGALTASQIEDGHRWLLAVLIECGSTTWIEAVQELFRVPVTELALGGVPINE